MFPDAPFVAQLRQAVALGREQVQSQAAVRRTTGGLVAIGAVPIPPRKPSPSGTGPAFQITTQSVNNFCWLVTRVAQLIKPGQRGEHCGVSADGSFAVEIGLVLANPESTYQRLEGKTLNNQSQNNATDREYEEQISFGEGLTIGRGQWDCERCRQWHDTSGAGPR